MSTSNDFTGLSDGNHTVDIMVFDLAGNNAYSSVNFTVALAQPAQSSQSMLLALLSLAGTQGSTGPLIYATVGAVGVVVVAAGLFFYYRRMNA